MVKQHDPQTILPSAYRSPWVESLNEEDINISFAIAEGLWWRYTKLLRDVIHAGEEFLYKKAKDWAPTEKDGDAFYAAYRVIADMSTGLDIAAVRILTDVVAHLPQLGQVRGSLESILQRALAEAGYTRKGIEADMKEEALSFEKWIVQFVPGFKAKDMHLEDYRDEEATS